MECDEVKRLRYLIGDIVSTLRVNLYRGNITTEYKEQFEAILDGWSDKKIIKNKQDKKGECDENCN